MIEALAIFIPLIVLIIMRFFSNRRERRAGQTKAKLENAESVLENIEKGNDAVSRLDDERRKRLHDRYPNIK